MPEPAGKTEIDKAIERWDGLRPPDDTAYRVGRDEERTARIQGLREFADLMEIRPDLPKPSSVRFPVYLNGTFEQQQAQLQYASELLGQPVNRRYQDSGMLRLEEAFGPVMYSIIAIEPTDRENGAPAFTVGQEVRLTAEAAHVAETARLAQAGTVVGIEPDPDGTECTYTVHFPGSVGTQRGWTESALRTAPPFSPVTLSTGEAASLSVAEALLIERGAAIKLRALSVRRPDDVLLSEHFALASAVSQACGLTRAELLRQIEPQFEEQVRGHLSAHGLAASKTAPELAASDGRYVTAAIEIVPVQGDDPSAPENPVPAAGRGKAR